MTDRYDDIIFLGLKPQIEKALRDNGFHNVQDVDEFWYRIPYIRGIGINRLWDICDAMRHWKENT